jgi:hypothetical protein
MLVADDISKEKYIHNLIQLSKHPLSLMVFLRDQMLKMSQKCTNYPSNNRENGVYNAPNILVEK